MPATVHESAWYAHQSLYAQKIVTTRNGIFRANIRRNAHDDQSHAHSERFDGRRWHRVHTAWIGELRIAEFSYVQHERKAAQWREAAFADCDDLLGLADQITAAAHLIERRTRREGN